MTGVELVRTTVDLELLPTLDLPGLPANVPAGTLLVRFDESARDDMTLVVPVLEGPIMPAWTAIDPALMVPEAPVCPVGELTVPALYELGQSAALCFGSLPFTFGGFLPGACGVADVPVSGEPDWLNDFASGVTLYGQRVRQALGSQPPASGWVSARPAPGVSFAMCDEAVANQFHLVTAHFDDPASAACRTEMSGGGPVTVEEAAASIARCRLTMVITATEPLPNR